jgi:hypothetical protein
MNRFRFLRFILLILCYYLLFIVPSYPFTSGFKYQYFVSLSQSVLFFFRPFQLS